VDEDAAAGVFRDEVAGILLEGIEDIGEVERSGERLAAAVEDVRTAKARVLRASTSEKGVESINRAGAGRTRSARHPLVEVVEKGCVIDAHANAASVGDDREGGGPGEMIETVRTVVRGRKAREGHWFYPRRRMA
jgi:hypothetical protein